MSDQAGEWLHNSMDDLHRWLDAYERARWLQIGQLFSGVLLLPTSTALIAYAGYVANWMVLIPSIFLLAVGILLIVRKPKDDLPEIFYKAFE